MLVPRFNRSTKPKNKQQKNEISKGKEIYDWMVRWDKFFTLAGGFPKCS